MISSLSIKFDVGMLVTIFYVAILLVNYHYGAMNGLFAQAFISCKLFISLLVAKHFGNIVYTHIYNSEIHSEFNNFVSQIDILNIISTFKENNSVSAIDWFSLIFDGGVIDSIKNNAIIDTNQFFGKISSDILEIIRQNAYKIINVLTGTSLKFFSYIITFIVSMIIINLIIKVLPIINDIPLAGSINKLFGGIFSILNTLLITEVCLLVFKAISFLPYTSHLIYYIKLSNVLNYLYEHNILMVIINGFIKSF